MYVVQTILITLQTISFVFSMVLFAALVRLWYLMRSNRTLAQSLSTSTIIRSLQLLMVAAASSALYSLLGLIPYMASNERRLLFISIGLGVLGLDSATCWTQVIGQTFTFIALLVSLLLFVFDLYMLTVKRRVDWGPRFGKYYLIVLAVVPAVCTIITLIMAVTMSRDRRPHVALSLNACNWTLVPPFFPFLVQFLRIVFFGFPGSLLAGRLCWKLWEHDTMTWGFMRQSRRLASTGPEAQLSAKSTLPKSVLYRSLALAVLFNLVMLLLFSLSIAGMSLPDARRRNFVDAVLNSAFTNLGISFCLAMGSGTLLSVLVNDVRWLLHRLLPNTLPTTPEFTPTLPYEDTDGKDSTSDLESLPSQDPSLVPQENASSKEKYPWIHALVMILGNSVYESTCMHVPVNPDSKGQGMFNAISGSVNYRYRPPHALNYSRPSIYVADTSRDTDYPDGQQDQNRPAEQDAKEVDRQRQEQQQQKDQTAPPTPVTKDTNYGDKSSSNPATPRNPPPAKPSLLRQSLARSWIKSIRPLSPVSPVASSGDGSLAVTAASQPERKPKRGRDSTFVEELPDSPRGVWFFQSPSASPLIPVNDPPSQQ